MAMDSCKYVRHRLNRLMDGDLSATVTQRLESHMSACSACREEYEALKQVKLYLKELPSLAPSETSRLRAIIRLESMRLRRPAIWPRLLVATTLVATMGVVVFFSTLPSPSHTTEPGGILPEPTEIAALFDLHENLTSAHDAMEQAEL